MNERSHEIVIVGGGLVGCLLAMVLGRRGHDVVVYEGRWDMRKSGGGGGRSINLVATDRGLAGLDPLGMREAVLELTVSVPGRMMHSVNGELTYQPYGKSDAYVNHSVPRGELNKLLMTHAERAGARFVFGHRLLEADLAEGSLVFDGAGERVTVEAGRVFGADGAGSKVRPALMKLAGGEESMEDLGHGYKELEIPPAAGGGFRIKKHALHIWPRGRFMLMALPNLDGSFTVTLYLPDRGPYSFEEIDTPARVRELFEEHFPDAIPLIPALEAEYFDNPTGYLGTLRCAPWHYGDRALLIGDAAHAIVPFFGQGMNCGFEDCRVLHELMERHGDDWGRIFESFTAARKPNGDAIADMALDNFIEMSERVGDPGFLLRKAVEQRLANELPGHYRSRYSMVVYSQIPYRLCQEAGVIQAGILDELCAGIDRPEDVDMTRAARLLEERFAPFVKTHDLDLDY